MTTTTLNAAPTQTHDATAAETILARSVCLVLACSTLGNRRKVSLTDIAMQEDGDDLAAEKNELRLTKTLLDRKLLKPVAALFSSMKAYLRGVATQGHRVFGPGTYLVPIALVEQVEARLEQFRMDIAIAVEKLVADYPAAVEARRETLGKLFAEKDYLSPSEVRDQYDASWSYVSFSAPENLESVDRVLYQKAQAKYQGKLSLAFDEVESGLRESALQVMADLVERLTPGADGKPKTLRGTALRDLEEFVEKLPARNITDDAALADAVAHVAALADGMDVSTLKRAPGVRASLLAEAEKATAVLTGLVETSGRRGISFGKIGL